MKRILISLALTALSVTAAPALASGSGSSARAGLGAGSPFASGFSEEERLQQRGRSQLKKRVTCKTCEYADGVNKANAAEVAQAVRDGKFAFPEKDKAAVLHYLRQRYGV
jgi:hypothetical protein